MVNWEDIHPDFAKEYYGSGKSCQQIWEEAGLTCQEAQAWIPAGFEPKDYWKVNQWKNLNFTSQEAKQWIEAGLTIYESNYVKEWKTQGFTPEQTKSWLDAGLNSHEINFANYLKQNNQRPSQLSTDKLFELRKEFCPGYPQAQEYLNRNYPCNCNNRNEYNNRLIHQENCPRNTTPELNLRKLNLTGDLDLEGFPWYLKVYLSGNPQLGEIKNKPDYTTIIYQNLSEFFNKFYPNKNQVERIVLNYLNFEQLGELVLDNYPNLKEIDGWTVSDLIKITISNCLQLEEMNIHNFKNLQALILNNLPNLKALDCSENKLTTLDLSDYANLQEINCSGNHLTEIKLPAGEKLEILALGDNNFRQDLSFLSNFVNLKGLWLGNNNFTGNLEYLKGMNKLERLDIRDTYIDGTFKPLQNLTKLWSLNISNTDLDSGLEYLTDSIEEFYCSVNRKGAKCQALYNLFAKDSGIKKFPQKLQEYKLNLQIKTRDQQIQLFQKERTQFEEQETKINYLESRIKELTDSSKNQKQKILQAFSRLLPEKVLLQELIKTYLEFVRFKKQGLGSSDYRKQLKVYKKCYEENEDKLEEKLDEKAMNEIQQILTDCEELVAWELELEAKLKDKSLRIEEHKQNPILKVTDGKEEAQIKSHEETHQNQIQQVKRERSYSVVSEIAKMQGIIETQKEGIQYLRPTFPLLPTNKTHLITQLKTKQTLTLEEINQINNYLKAKQAFLQARQETIKELQQCLNAFEKKLGKHNKISEVGNIVGNVGGTISGVITFGIPQDVGEVIKSSNNFSKIKHTKKSSKEFQNTLGGEEQVSLGSEEKDKLSQLKEIRNILASSLGLKEQSLFNTKYEIHDVLLKDGIWKNRTLTQEKIKKAIVSLGENLEELKASLAQEEKQFKELSGQLEQQAQILHQQTT